MFKKQLANFKNIDKDTKIKFWSWMFIAILAFICLVEICVFLAISYQQTSNYVYDNFNPESGLKKDLLLPNYYKDFFLDKELMSYGELFESIGKDSFSWFYLTHLYPISLVPYILLPFVVIIFLVSSICLFFTHRKIYPPIKKNKNSDKGGN